MYHMYKGQVEFYKTFRYIYFIELCVLDHGSSVFFTVVTDKMFQCHCFKGLEATALPKTDRRDPLRQWGRISRKKDKLKRHLKQQRKCQEWKR